MKMKYLEYTYAEAERMKQLNRLGTARNYACAARRFGDYLNTLGKHDTAFSRLKPQMVRGFEDWLKKEGVGHNTSSAYLRCLHAVFMRAVAEKQWAGEHGSGMGIASGDPFVGTYRGVAKTTKRAVTPEDMRTIAGLDVESALLRHYQDDGKKTDGALFRQKADKLTFARDLFLFCFCARGMTFVDVAYLRKSDIRSGLITYCRRKTGQRLMVKVEADMQTIIDRYPSATAYQFPILTDGNDQTATYKSYLSAAAYYNQALKELGELLGLKLTSYVSRHSWATIAHQNDVPMAIISQAMGHDSERTTEIYLKSLSSTRIDQANHTLLQSLFHTP